PGQTVGVAVLPALGVLGHLGLDLETAQLGEDGLFQLPDLHVEPAIGVAVRWHIRPFARARPSRSAPAPNANRPASGGIPHPPARRHRCRAWGLPPARDEGARQTSDDSRGEAPRPQAARAAPVRPRPNRPPQCGPSVSPPPPPRSFTRTNSSCRYAKSD